MDKPFASQSTTTELHLFCLAAHPSPELRPLVARMCRSAMDEITDTGGARGNPGHIQRVVLWAPPRSLSTAVERALIEHKEIEVQHEPFGAPHYWSGEAASTRSSAYS